MTGALMARVALLLVLATTVARAGQDPHEGALRALVERWVAARNANDAEGMRGLFAADVDQVRLPAGEVVATDLDGLVRWFDSGFKRDGRSTTARVESTRVRVLSPDAAIVDFGFTLLGPAQRRVSTGYATFVCTKGEAGWKVAALRFASTPAE